jgi:predicted PurR-regulated permease PerM
MTLQRQVTFWFAALAVLVAALWLLSEILLPFVAGMALAYLLDPFTRRIERLGIGRTAAALVVVVLMLFVLIVLIILIAPILVAQLAAFIDNLPGYVTRLQALVTDPSRPWLAKIFGEGLPDPGKSVNDLMAQGARWLGVFIGSLWSGGKALVSLFSLLVITPVVAFYLLCDWDRMIVTVDHWVPLPQRDTVHALTREIDDAIAAYVRGQAGICLVLGAYYAVGLTLTGLNFGFLIGFATGLASFVPYVGSLTGVLIAIAVAIAQFWPSWTPILIVLGIAVVGQVLESYVLAPRLVGAKIGLHPVWLIFALLAFGYLFGIVGLLVAIPLAAAIGVLARFGLRQYLASPFYTGGEPR